MMNKMTQKEFDKLMYYKVFPRQKELASNDNFRIKGFEKNKVCTMLQAFMEELGLLEIVDE